MRLHPGLIASLAISVVACGQDVSSGTTDGNGNATEGYPPPPYGVGVNRTIANFVFPGYLSNSGSVLVNTLPFNNELDLQTVRTTPNGDGNPFRYLLLDISAGWCPPCNQEAQDLGQHGSSNHKINDWLAQGGLFMTVLAEGYDESTHNAPVAADIETWINQHAVTNSVGFDPDQTLIAEGINPSAFPTNLVIELDTMMIVSAWYGLDTTYQKWEAALANY